MTRQSGYALLLLVVMLMGLGGVVLTGFTQGAKQDVDHQRFLHNQRILNEAKLALLQYAYNYPVNYPGRGPGRLPCPDTNNNGSSNTLFECEDSAEGMVGRFPWNHEYLSFYDARDASGERLWYAVSKNFANSRSSAIEDKINSDTPGTITIVDRSGAILYDGTASGVAAVIIAPGPPIDRAGTAQDRSITNNDDRFDTVIDTDDGIIKAANYLDVNDMTDNSEFKNETDNGFIAGPIADVVSGILYVNDQMIVITAAEVIAMAEKATLHAYRNSIREYLDIVGTCTGIGTNRSLCVSGGGTWNAVYPWLYDYQGTTDLTTLNTAYPANSDFPTELGTRLDNYGRIPTIFADYFTETSTGAFQSKLEVELEISFPTIAPVVSTASGNQLFNGGIRTLEFTTANILTMEFSDIGDIGAEANGRLAVTVPFNENIPLAVFYFWDEDNGPETGRWTLCADGGGELSDCHRTIGGVATPGGSNDNREEILRIEFQINLDAGDVVFFDADYNTVPIINHFPADGDGHATIEASFLVDNMDSDELPITAIYQLDRHYHEGNLEPFIAEEAGTIDVADLLSEATLKLGLRYFPKLPRWALDNDWHNAIRMAYAEDYRPDVYLPGDVCDGSTCLQRTDMAGDVNSTVSLLVIAAEHGWLDDSGLVGLQGELLDVFDIGNEDGDLTFYNHRGNDKIVAIEEL